MYQICFDYFNLSNNGYVSYVGSPTLNPALVDSPLLRPCLPAVQCSRLSLPARLGQSHTKATAGHRKMHGTRYLQLFPGWGARQYIL